MRSEYHTQLAKMSFDEIFDLAAGVYFSFLYYLVWWRFFGWVRSAAPGLSAPRLPREEGGHGIGPVLEFIAPSPRVTFWGGLEILPPHLFC